MQHVTAVLCCPRSRPTVTCRSACSPRGPTPCCNHTALPSRGTAGGIGCHLVVKRGTTCTVIYRPASPRVRLACILTDGLHLEPVAHFEGLVQRHPHHTTKTVYFQGTACREKQETDEQTSKWKIEQQKSCKTKAAYLSVDWTAHLASLDTRQLLQPTNAKAHLREKERNMVVHIEVRLNAHLFAGTYILTGHPMSLSQFSQTNTKQEPNLRELLNENAALTDKSSSDATGLTSPLKLQQLFYSNSSTHRWGQLVINWLQTQNMGGRSDKLVLHSMTFRLNIIFHFESALCTCSVAVLLCVSNIFLI